MQKTIFFLLVVMILLIPVFSDSRAEDPYLIPKGLLARFIICMMATTYLFRVNRWLAVLVFYVGLSCFVKTGLAPWSLMKFENMCFAGFLYYMIFKEVKEDKIKLIIGLICLTGILQSLYCILQAFDCDLLFTTRAPEVFKNKIAGFLGNPNRIGVYVAMTGTLTLGMMNRKRLWLVFPWVLQMVVIGLTACSNAAISVTAGTVFVLACKIKNKCYRTWFLILIVSASFVTISHVDKLDIRKDPMRPSVWKKTVEMANENPLMGKGIGSFYVLFHKQEMPPKVKAYIGESNQRHFFQAHNDPLQMLFELGRIGIMIILAIYLTMTERFIKVVKSPEIMGVAGAIVVFSTFSLASFPIHQPSVAFLFIILIALFDILCRHIKSQWFLAGGI